MYFSGTAFEIWANYVSSVQKLHEARGFHVVTAQTVGEKVFYITEQGSGKRRRRKIDT